MCFAMGCGSGWCIPFCHRSAIYRWGSVMQLMLVGTLPGGACLDAVICAQHVLSVLHRWDVAYMWPDVGWWRTVFSQNHPQAATLYLLYGLVGFGGQYSNFGLMNCAYSRALRLRLKATPAGSGHETCTSPQWHVELCSWSGLLLT